MTPHRSPDAFVSWPATRRRRHAKERTARKAAAVDDRLLELVIRPDPAEVRTARQFVGDNLHGLVADDVIADLELITSELVTNAVEHGADQAIEIAVRCADGEISITVVSEGPSSGVGPVPTWQLAPIDEVTGRGLGIVRLVADHVEVDQSTERLTLTACRRVGGRRSRLAGGSPG